MVWALGQAAERGGGAAVADAAGIATEVRGTVRFFGSLWLLTLVVNDSKAIKDIEKREFFEIMRPWEG